MREIKSYSKVISEANGQQRDHSSKKCQLEINFQYLQAVKLKKHSTKIVEKLKALISPCTSELELTMSAQDEAGKVISTERFTLKPQPTPKSEIHELVTRAFEDSTTIRPGDAETLRSGLQKAFDIYNRDYTSCSLFMIGSYTEKGQVFIDFRTSPFGDEYARVTWTGNAWSHNFILCDEWEEEVVTSSSGHADFVISFLQFEEPNPYLYGNE